MHEAKHTFLCFSFSLCNPFIPVEISTCRTLSIFAARPVFNQFFYYEHQQGILDLHQNGGICPSRVSLKGWETKKEGLQENRTKSINHKKKYHKKIER